MGNIDIGGFQRFGPQTSVNVQLVQNVFGIEHGLTWQRGRHLLKIGGLVERYQDNMINPTFGLGIFTFNDLPAFLQNRATRFIGLSPNGALDRYWRSRCWHVCAGRRPLTSRLTLNARTAV